MDTLHILQNHSVTSMCFSSSCVAEQHRLNLESYVEYSRLLLYCVHFIVQRCHKSEPDVSISLAPTSLRLLRPVSCSMRAIIIACWSPGCRAMEVPAWNNITEAEMHSVMSVNRSVTISERHNTSLAKYILSAATTTWVAVFPPPLSPVSAKVAVAAEVLAQHLCRRQQKIIEHGG